MKNLIFLLPLLLLVTVGKAQFNTASYQHNVATVDVSELDENHFQATFLNYHLEEVNNKKNLKEQKKQKRKLAKQAREKPENPVQPSTANSDEIVQEKTTAKKVVYKKLKPITEDDFDYVERQAVYMPLNHMIITSRFGNRFNPIDKVVQFHTGVDLRAADSLVYAVLDGIVLDAGYTKECGNYIKILHKGNFETIYLHLSKFYYTKDDTIHAGDIIAQSGDTGKSTAPHLHFAVKENNNYVDPIEFLNDLIQTNNALSDYGN